MPDTNDPSYQDTGALTEDAVPEEGYDPEVDGQVQAGPIEAPGSPSSEAKQNEGPGGTESGLPKGASFHTE